MLSIPSLHVVALLSCCRLLHVLQSRKHAPIVFQAEAAAAAAAAAAVPAAPAAKPATAKPATAKPAAAPLAKPVAVQPKQQPKQQTAAATPPQQQQRPAEPATQPAAQEPKQPAEDAADLDVSAAEGCHCVVQGAALNSSAMCCVHQPMLAMPSSARPAALTHKHLPAIRPAAARL